MSEKRYTDQQLQEFKELSWWNLEHAGVRALFNEWKERNGLTDEILDEMMEEITK